MANTQQCSTEGCNTEVTARKGSSGICKPCYQKTYHANKRATDPAYRERTKETLKRSRDKRKAADPVAYARQQRDRYLYFHYGIHVEDYEAQLEKQGGTCKLCPKTEGDEGGYLRVDHDHSCCPGVRSCGDCLRGLLCDGCNTGLGKFYDDVDLLRNAIDYLEMGGDW